MLGSIYDKWNNRKRIME